MLHPISVRPSRAEERLGPYAKAVLASEILGAYLRARSLLARNRLPDTVAALRDARPANGRTPLSGPGYDGLRLGSAVVKTLGRLPADSRCLMRSLVLLRLLARRGRRASLVIAVRPGGEVGVDAHAWVEVDGQPLLAPATDDFGHLLTL